MEQGCGLVFGSDMSSGCAQNWPGMLRWGGRGVLGGAQRRKAGGLDELMSCSPYPICWGVRQGQ